MQLYFTAIGQPPHIIAEYSELKSANKNVAEICRSIVKSNGATLPPQKENNVCIFNTEHNGFIIVSAYEGSNTKKIREFSEKTCTKFKSLLNNTRAQPPNERKIAFTRALQSAALGFNSQSKTSAQLERMKSALEGVSATVQQSIGLAVERGERISDLVEKSSVLKSEALAFRSAAVAANAPFWRRHATKVFGAVAAIIFFMWLYRAAA